MPSQSEASAVLDPDRLHAEATIVDGLVFMGDGYAADLQAGNVAAINLTVTHMEADFAEACDAASEWAARTGAAGGAWRLVRNVDDIGAAKTAGKVGLIMGWQNMRPIADQLHRIAFFHGLGVRVMQLTYNTRNFVGDGCLEPENSGLSLFGRRAIAEMNRVGVAIDLSHVGERTALQAAELSDKPVFLTHANAHAVVAMPRNKSDSLLKAVAGTGGTIGLSIYGPMCWDRNPAHEPCLDDFLRHLDHIVNLVGIDSVAFGTDLPAVKDLRTVDRILEMTRTRFPENVGAYEAAFGGGARQRYLREIGSPLDFPLITRALVERGWSAAEVKGLLGENFIRALGKVWVH
ncbi:MAG: membrane dipeptidase [Alphaproteobacteria bacterium]|nr:membrane dipeptidase [Alphaproteobacteria bacterium]